MPNSLISIIAFILFCSSCSVFRHKEFDRGGISSQLGVEKPVYDNSAIQKTFQKKPNLPKPFKLAVYFKTPKSTSNYEKNQWRWTEEDKAFLDTITKTLVSQKLVSEVFPLVSSLVTDESLKSIRMVAAQHQADALLIVSGAGAVDRYLNKAGASYALIVPLLFVPGSKAEVLFVTNAVVWDVKNEFLYLTAEAEATSSDTYVAAFGKTDKELYNEAKTLSLKKLEQELKSALENKKL